MIVLATAVGVFVGAVIVFVISTREYGKEVALLKDRISVYKRDLDYSHRECELKDQHIDCLQSMREDAVVVKAIDQYITMYKKKADDYKGDGMIDEHFFSKGCVHGLQLVRLIITGRI